jgi:hypothetical protein
MFHSTVDTTSIDIAIGGQMETVVDTFHDLDRVSPDLLAVMRDNLPSTFLHRC